MLRVVRLTHPAASLSAASGAHVEPFHVVVPGERGHYRSTVTLSGTDGEWDSVPHMALVVSGHVKGAPENSDGFALEAFSQVPDYGSPLAIEPWEWGTFTVNTIASWEARVPSMSLLATASPLIPRFEGV